ncbi:hypothetical protein GPSY_4007 [Paraglaciecola psychrophila 170]|nr:hypothetical protein GPSY_4007 [Paraglaciecola psychrophila 170]
MSKHRIELSMTTTKHYLYVGLWFDKNMVWSAGSFADASSA